MHLPFPGPLIYLLITRSTKCPLQFSPLFHPTMASNRKLNPNAAPFFEFPKYTVTRVAPAPTPRVYPYYPSQFQFNFNTQVNYFAPSVYEKADNVTKGGFQVLEAAVNLPKNAVKGKKFRNLPPRFRCKRKEVSLCKKEQLWLPKNSNVEDTKIVKKQKEVNFGGKTSLMIRNIPNQFLRDTMLQILDKHCLEENKHKSKTESAYDFLYLPMDFSTGGNFGYAFVNFTTSAGVTRFYQAFNNFEWDVPFNRKICKICCAKIQGKVAFVNHFKNSVFSCSQKGYLPVVLTPPRDGNVCSRVTVIGNYRKPNPDEAKI